MKKWLMLVVLLGAAARAEAEGIGLYTPSAPFDGPVARLDYVSALASHVAGKTGKPMTGRAYAKAGDFAAAVKRGEIQYAVVEAAYLATAGGQYTVLGVAERGGATQVAWEVVSSTPAKSVLDLRGKTTAVPDLGARGQAFVTQVLFEGELPLDHFNVIPAPDALSALAAVERGRAEVAIVPAGLPLPGGVHRVATLGTISWPLLVAYPGATGGEEVGAAATSFGGKGFDRFARGGGEGVRGIAGRFGGVNRRPPLAIPQLRLAASALLVGRKFTIARPDVTAYLGGGSGK